MQEIRKPTINNWAAGTAREGEKSFDPQVMYLLPVGLPGEGDDAFTTTMRPGLKIYGNLCAANDATTGATVMRVLEAEYLSSIQFGARAQHYKDFCEATAALENYIQHTHAAPPYARAVLNDQFYIELLPAKHNEELATLCAAKGHICVIKLTYPDEATANTRKLVHGQAVVAQFGNYVLLKNGVICWVNWFAIVKRSNILQAMTNGAGIVDLKLRKQDNKLYIDLEGQPEDGYCYIQIGEFMDNPHAKLILDCHQCKSKEELATIHMIS